MKDFFDFTSFIVVLFKRWKLILANCFLISIIAIGYSFYFAEKQFVSSITFLPPPKENSMFGFMPNISALPLSYSSNIMPQQIATIFNSKALRRRIIEKFNYYQKFELHANPNKFEVANRRLKRDILMEIEETGSLGVATHISYALSSYHTSPDTCYQIVKYAFFLIDSMLNHVNVDRGKQHRQFIEGQLELNRAIYDSLQVEFNKFQKENKVYNISQQVKLTLESYATLKAQLIANEIKLKELRIDYSSTFPLVQELQKKNAVLRHRIRGLEKSSDPDVFIGLVKSADLAPIYKEFLRGIEVQDRLILLLTQQLEEARLKEARDFSSLKIIDPAFVPEYKVRPKRLVLCVVIFSVYMIIVLSLIILHHVFITYIVNTKLFNELLKVFKK